MAKKMDLKVLRQRAAELRAEGDKLATELEELLAVEEPTDEQEARLAELQSQFDDWEVRSAKARDELQRGEDAARRTDLMNSLKGSSRIIVGTTYGADPRQTGGFDSVADFALTVMHAGDPNSTKRVDAQQKLAEAQQLMAAPSNFHLERATTEGAMVPPVYRQQIFELMLDDQGAVMNQVDSEPTSGNQVALLRDETTPWGSTGVQANWRAEGTQMTASRLDTATSDIKLHELYAFVLATEELLEDAPRMNARLTTQAARALNWKGSSAIFDGSGAGQPLGWMNSSALVTVAKEASQAADTVLSENVTKMFSRMMPSSLSRAVWYVNSDVLPQIMALKDAAGNAVWFPNYQVSPAGVLMGRPLIPQEHCATVGDLGDIQFVDPLGYYSPRKSSGVQFAESMHLFFDYNIRAFRWTFRMGGQPYLSAAVSPAKGSNTKSHFIALAARA